MNTFYGLQALRYVAAILVAGMHVFEAISQRSSSNPHINFGFGGIGVDIFFVISGFIMAATTEKTPQSGRYATKASRTFLIRRLIRIFPMYWFYTGLKVACVLLLPALALRTQLDPWHVALSAILFPAVSPWGLIQPVLPVGWTLSFEILFYLIFAASIALSMNKLLFCLVAFGCIFASRLVFPEITFTRFFGQSIIFEFALGIAAFQANRFIQHRRISWGSAALSCGLLMGVLSTVYNASADRLTSFGLSAFLIVTGVLLLESKFRGSFFRRYLVPLGDSSYSLYLSHSFTVPATVIALGFIDISNPLLVVPITLVSATIGGVLSFKLIEQPIHQRLMEMIKPQLRLGPTPS